MCFETSRGGKCEKLNCAAGEGRTGPLDQEAEHTIE